MPGGRIRPNSVRLKDGGNFVPIRDGLISAVSGMGTTTDPRMHAFYAADFMADQQIDYAYRASWVIRKAIDRPAFEMVREWRDWQADKADIEALEAEEKRLDLRNKVRRAEVLRGLGGAGLVMWVRGQNPMSPLAPETIKAGDLQTIHVWHRSRFSLGEMIGAWDSPWFGHPSYYEVQLQGTQGGTPMRFHPSRVVAFKAEQVGDIAGGRWHDCFWGQSRVQTILDAAKNVDTAENGFAALIKDARNRRIYIPDLLNMVSTQAGEQKLAKRLRAFALGESSNSVSWLDGGTATSDGKLLNAEKIEDRQMNWAGMPDIMNAYRTAMAAAADMPVTVLWGTSPAGMNATGESDLSLFEKSIKGRQDLDLRPCMTQIDAALIPSALGRVDDTIWYDWAPLSSQSEKDEATTWWNTMQGLKILADTGLVPTIALEKATQTLISERGWMPGLDDALGDLPEDERFPSLAQPELDANGQPIDPSAITQPVAKGGDPTSAGGAGANGSVPARRAANDARFTDAAPKTLYVERKLLNTAEFIAWAKGQGFETTTPADELHVTIAYSRQPLDWMKIGQDWSSDKEGRLTVNAGGPRIVQALGDKGAVVLLFGSNDLSWRHQAIREAGASFDFEEYQPHVTITYAAPAGLDLSKFKPYTGPLVFGPELFSEINDGWASGITEE